MSRAYVHGYDERESTRLQDQASSVLELLHSDTRYPAGASVLEAGCGTGAQTVTLARNNPGAHFTSVDLSSVSLEEAKKRVAAAGLSNVQFRQEDIFALPFAPASFDHVFVCFLLEHLARPLDALRALKTMLKPAAATRFFASSRDTRERSTEVKRAPGLLRASVTVCAPVPQPASSTDAPAG